MPEVTLDPTDTVRLVQWRTRDMVAIATLVAAPATLAVALDPSVRFAYEATELRTALETAQALIATSAAYLVYGRVKRGSKINDLAIVFALGLLGASSLFFAAMPRTVLEGNLVFQTWAPLVNRLIACAVICWAAITPDRPLSRRIERPGVSVILTTDIVLVVVAVVVASMSSVLPQGVEVSDDTAGALGLHGHPVLLGTYLLMAGLSAFASYGFVRRSSGRRDPLTAALAVGCVLQAFAFLCFAIYPSIDTEIIQSGDALRLGFYLVLLIGGEREIDRYWNRIADIAIYDERRRLARDLHDGVAQELAFVVTQTRLLQRGSAPPDTDQRVAAAAERALDESRRAIIALTLRDDEPLHLALTRAAEDVAGRVGVDVRIEIDPTTAVPPAVREGLVRIVQESVSNAGRHGKAEHVRVTLDSRGVLRIVDDGKGFDPATAGDGRFGLVSMRERAERMGGKLSVESEPGKGTKVEVALP